MREYITGRLLPAVALAMVTGILSGGNVLFAASEERAASPVSYTDNAGNTYTVGPDGTLIKKEAERPADDPAFAAFDEWRKKYAAAPDAQKAALQSEGVALSQARRAAMKELIQRNPQRALELSVGAEERQGLPSEVVQNLEEFVQGRGEFGVISQTIVETVPAPDKEGETRQVFKSTLRRTLTFDGRVYTAFVYGKREGLLTKTRLPFHGIAVDNVVAIHESPIWVLPAGQKPPAGATPSKSGTECPICKKKAEGGIVGIVGSTIYYFDTERDLEKFRENLWEAEAIIGPNEHA